MTIQDALERAKELQKQRKKDSAATPRESGALSAPGDTTSLAALRVELRAEPIAETVYAALNHVQFDSAECARNHILASDAQLVEARQAAAAYRLLRGRVMHKVKSGGWSCIGVTSAGPGEGKTVTALNLAISIAREKLRTVYLLDLDMRNASVFKRVGVSPPVPLSRYFIEGVTPDEVLYETSIEHLVMAGNRETIPSASELLASNKLDQLLTHIRRRSKDALIIIDLPPVLSTDEALVVAPRLDAAFVVVAEGLTRRDGLAKALDQLRDFNVAGVVLNRSGSETGLAYYGY